MRWSPHDLRGPGIRALVKGPPENLLSRSYPWCLLGQPRFLFLQGQTGPGRTHLTSFYLNHNVKTLSPPIVTFSGW